MTRITTGWPPGLLQDDSRELSSWFSSRPGARRLVDERCAEIRAEVAARIIRSDDRLELDRLLMTLPGDDEATLAHDEREHEDMIRPPGW